MFWECSEAVAEVMLRDGFPGQSGSSVHNMSRSLFMPARVPGEPKRIMADSMAGRARRPTETKQQRVAMLARPSRLETVTVRVTDPP